MQLNPLAVDDLSGGMASNVDDDLLDNNTASYSVNLNYDLLGKATQRNGTVILGAAVSTNNPGQGIAQFITSNQLTNRLVAAFNGNNYAYDGAAWSNIGGGMTSAAVRYESFTPANRLFRVGGGVATQSWGGSGSFDGTLSGGAPIGKYIKAYKQRLYIAGDSNYPNRLWFSTIASITGNIMWDTSGSSTQYIDFTGGQANDIITGLGKISNLLIVFLNNTIFRYNGSSTDPEIVVDIGCSSQESIAQGKGWLFFFNPLGIFRTRGGYPEEISRSIMDWIQNMNSTNYANVSGFCDDNHYYCNIGNVTFSNDIVRGNRTFNNVWLVFTISSQTWAVYSFFNNFNALTTYKTTAGAITYVGADSVGNVQTIFSGNTDNGKPIVWEYQSRQYNFGSYLTTNTIIDMGWLVDNGTGAQTMIAPDRGKFIPTGEITGMTTFQKSMNIIGKAFAFRIEGSNSAMPVIFNGFEVYNAISQGYVV